MPRFSMAQTLSSAVPQVFDFLADPRNMPRWNSGVAEVDDRRIIPCCEGARYRYRFPGRHRFHHLVCSAYRSPSLLGFRGERMWTPLGAQTVAYTFRVRSAEYGSRLEVTVDVSVNLGMTLLLPVITLGWRRDLPEDLQRLSDTLDAHSPPSTGGAQEVRIPPASEPAARHTESADDQAV
ncbi:SRPBCC family protein [Streptomyces sp. N2-109]|uniref:SRPBCC family protein n=1 Tax=Streptomyces gossypii TaxID=2883101 RepID=A0ABT2JUV5_9ACTN|nr:SRPBCC family protein [Streptomyces gossypii]MCT2591666.1 SRPBCC family protein [Streptomyces gossypii]